MDPKRTPPPSEALATLRANIRDTGALEGDPAFLQRAELALARRAEELKAQRLALEKQPATYARGGKVTPKPAPKPAPTKPAARGTSSGKRR